ncbi:UNVERIFIED_CONTAM: hypothetical protein Slati_3860500 [Sesamum latifolium]|uniref:Uncharacterized protein n=1 Tax=Sesamum latifolium TaxID=2727402 RepID=A0AAW2TPA6_9LAMI
MEDIPGPSGESHAQEKEVDAEDRKKAPVVGYAFVLWVLGYAFDKAICAAAWLVPGCLLFNSGFVPRCLLFNLSLISRCLHFSSGLVPGCLLFNSGFVPGCLLFHSRLVPGCLLFNSGLISRCLHFSSGLVPGCLLFNSGLIPRAFPFGIQLSHWFQGVHPSQHQVSYLEIPKFHASIVGINHLKYFVRGCSYLRGDECLCPTYQGERLSPMEPLGVVRYDQRTLVNSLTQLPPTLSSLFLMPWTNIRLVTSTCPLAWGWDTEVPCILLYGGPEITGSQCLVGQSAGSDMRPATSVVYFLKYLQAFL